MKRKITVFIITSIFNTLMLLLNITNNANFIKNCSNLEYVAEKNVKAEKNIANENNKILIGDWNIATYSINTKTTSFEYFNEHYYYQRNVTYSKELKESYNYSNDYPKIEYTNDGRQYTKGYNPTAKTVKMKSDIGIIGNDERVKISNPKALPYYTTGKIEAVWYNVKGKDGNIFTVTGSGTGSMQGPNLLVTAAHCVYGDLSDDGINNPTFPNIIRYYPGLNGPNDKSSCIVANALEISIDKEYYEKCSTEHDWAALKLSTNIGYITGWNGKMSNWYEENHAVYSFGYPSDKNEDMWLTNGRVTGKTDYIYKTDTDVIPGQSGSPLFTKVDSGTYMIGVVTHSHYYWLFGNHTDYNGATKINSFIFAFLNSFVTSSSNSTIENITPSDYGFADAYPNTSLTKTHKLDTGFEFTTKRYRTGYIQGEYIVMSPIKSGITEAYIEYCFDKPVYKIEVDLTYWRSISTEWLDKNNGVAELQVLNGNNWIKKFDLLSDETNLSTNRKNPKTYIINFSIPVTSFRFYTKINKAMISSNNKGRICIGNMTIFMA